MLIAGELVTAAVYAGNGYGTRRDALKDDKINIGIFNLYDIEVLEDDDEVDLITVLIEIPDDLRLMRLLRREPNETNKNIERFLRDQKDFNLIRLKVDVHIEHLSINQQSIDTLIESLSNLMKAKGWV